MFQVLENNKLCDCHHFNVHPSWNNAEFNDFESALQYAYNWFWPYLGVKGGNYIILEPNKPYEYEDNCFVEIREVV